KTFFKVGQFKIPYSRERLNDSGTIPFADRSIMNLGFRMGRDVGGAIGSGTGPLVGVVGLFTGGGMDVPQRYLPEVLGVPLLVGRVGFNNGLDANAFSERSITVGT